MTPFDWDIGQQSCRWAREAQKKDAMIPKENAVKIVERFHEICAIRGITGEEKEIIWWAMATVCYEHMRLKRGAFYEAIQQLHAAQATEAGIPKQAPQWPR